MGLALFFALTVAVEPTHLQIGAHPQVKAARVRIDGLPRHSRTLRLWSSAGTVSSAEVVGEGRVEAIYTPPAAGAPTFAVVAAWDDRTGEAAVATLELEARTDIPVETEPEAQVTVQVAGHRSTARADARGQAHVSAWVPPGVRTARVTAQDRAGNTTVAEVPLDLAPPERVWLIQGATDLQGVVRLYAFAIAPAVPRIRAPGAEVALSGGPGLSVARIRGTGDVVVTATVEDAVANVELHLASAPPPPAAEIVTLDLPPPAFFDPWVELGASIGPRFSGDLIGAEALVEWRRRLRRSRFHAGIDLGGVYANGTSGSIGLQLGGVIVRAAGETRFSLSEKVGVALGITLGGALVGERRHPDGAKSYSALDGGPAIGAFANLLTRLGPGLLLIGVGYTWTPLIGLFPTVLDGGLLTIGYRAGRF